VDRSEAPAWPGGRRLAVYVAVNLEHFAFGRGLGAELAPPPPGAAPDVLNYCWREWGNRVGAYRLLSCLEELGLPCAALVNSSLVEHAPGLVLTYLHHQPGCELVAHGVSNSEAQGGLGEAAEAALIREASEVLEQLRAAPGGASAAPLPLGWLSPWISESPLTPDLLAEAGYGYTLTQLRGAMTTRQPGWPRARDGRCWRCHIHRTG